MTPSEVYANGGTSKVFGQFETNARKAAMLDDLVKKKEMQGMVEQAGMQGFNAGAQEVLNRIYANTNTADNGLAAMLQQQQGVMR